MYNANIMLQMNDIDDFVQPRSVPSLLAVHGHRRPLPGAVVTLLAATHRKKISLKIWHNKRFASATRTRFLGGRRGRPALSAQNTLAQGVGTV